ncbi:hypothetical protein P7H20_01950 [Paenibacillus larvae]|nr:hypothetical protein [Paenibacillus larvae]MDT2236518.1 hypothetical protein [Paenibacillus larvae]MDT2240571.1 hypothetical protein [Paenibacillus larvae]MDT2262493.1 hypothetical protein [Paenibacillus larvae]MDT2273906.1 hypothetical protein [Paenibacillus larvae]
MNAIIMRDELIPSLTNTFILRGTFTLSQAILNYRLPNELAG